ncbi:MAG: hypothetical protein ACRELF_15750 [Gemmataceae bacterium]
MVAKGALRMLTAGVVYLSIGLLGKVGAADPPYVIRLRSREAVVTPEWSKNAQTGGGFIQVTQVEPNAVMAVMRGAVAARAEHKDGSATMQFALNQDFEILPTRAGLHPPRLVLAGWAIGALESSLRGGGTAEHSPACAHVRSSGQPILNLCVKPHAVGGGENLLVNDRVGPLEMVVVPGCFCLNQTFALHVAQSKSHCYPGSVAVVFDPEPKLDSQWNPVLKPFRAVPAKDFGFRVILRVVEDKPPPGELPRPREQKAGQPVLNEEKVGEAN